MNPAESAASRLDRLARVVAQGLWVSTDALADLLQMPATQFQGPGGQPLRQFVCRNLTVRRETATADGRSLWSFARADGPAASAPSRTPQLLVHRYAFLPDAQRAELLAYTLAHADAFLPAETLGSTSDYRQSLIHEIGPFAPLFFERVQQLCREVIVSLGMDHFTWEAFECQLLAYTNGCYFRAHEDRGNGPTAARRLSFIYYYHQRPKQFTGGELVMLARGPDGPGEVLTEVAPQDNSIVFFDSRRMHEVLPVSVPSGQFADSRFAVTGWVRCQE